VLTYTLGIIKDTNYMEKHSHNESMLSFPLKTQSVTSNFAYSPISPRVL
jgi:hypothetical protein